MKKMACNSEINLEKFMENPEFKEKLFGLIKETYSKSKITESEDEMSKNGSPSTKNNKRQSVGHRGRRSYKRRKVTNPPPPKKDDVDEDIKLILEDEGTKKKLASFVDECMHLKLDSDSSSEENVVETTEQDPKIINATDDIRRLSVEEIEIPNHSAKTKLRGRPSKIVKYKKELLEQPESKLNIADKNIPEVPLDKEIGSYILDPGAGVVMNDETKDDLPKKDDAIMLDSSKTSTNELISTESTSITDNNVSLEQPTDPNIYEEQPTLEQPTDSNTHEEQPTLEQSTDLNTNGEMSDVSQSDDFYYLNMANSNRLSLSDVSEAPEVTNITSDTFNNSNINNLSIMDEPIATTPEADEKILKPVIKSNKKVEQNKIVKSFTIPKLKNVNQFGKIQLKCLGSNSIQSTPNFQTIIVVTQNGEKPFNMLQPVEVLKPVKLKTIKTPVKKKVVPLKIPVNNSINSFEVPFKLQPATRKLTFQIGSPSVSKPFIKSNELVNLQVIRTSGSGIDDSIISDYSDNKRNDLDSTNSSNLPKIENVISCAEGLPIITNVTSCAASPPIIETMDTCVPSLQHAEDIISLAERISPDLITPSEKILKIKRKITKGRGRKKLQSNIVQQAENLESEVEKNSDSLNSSVSIGAMVEEVVTTGEEAVHDMHSVVLNEKKSEEDVVLHINGLSVEKSPRKGLKVLKPVKRVDCVDSEIGVIKITAVESMDRSGLPSIQNVVSLAENNVFDECLEEANQKLTNGNGIYTADITDEQFKVLQPRDDGFKSSDEFVENWDDVMSENGHFEDNFDYCVDSLIEDMSGKKKLAKKSPYKNRKSSPPFSTRQFGTSNGRNKELKVLKPVMRKPRKKGKRKAIFTRRKIRRSYPNVQDNIQNSKYDADVASINFADLSLVDTESTFVQSKYNDVPLGQSTPNVIDIPQRISPMKALRIGKYFYDDDTNDVENVQDEHPNGHITEPVDNSEPAAGNASDFSMEAPDEELLEEVPLQQRRCNNFYVKVPTGEELGSNINLEEYEKFFSIQDENDPTKIRKPEIESIDDDEDLPGTPGKRRTKCSKCDKTFIHSVTRKIHEATCENNEPQKSECSKCGRWFAKTAYRKIHEKKCQVTSGTIEIPITPLNDILRCAMCPFTTGHKTAYINHLKSHMYNHKKSNTLSAKAAAQRRKFGYRRRRRKVRFGPAKTRCEICNDDAGGVEHMVSRCRRCGDFNVQWCDECHQGGYSTACRLRHHEAQCSATPHTRCNHFPRVRLERLGPPLPLHCVSCDVTRILYVREKRCKQCSSQLLFKCEMCAELRDTFAELCGHVARAHIIGCLVQCDDCGKNCEDLSLHRRTCEHKQGEGEHEDESNAASSSHELMFFSEDDESNEDTSNLGLDNLILELDEDSDEDQEQIIEEI